MHKKPSTCPQSPLYNASINTLLHHTQKIHSHFEHRPNGSPTSPIPEFTLSLHNPSLSSCSFSNKSSCFGIQKDAATKLLLVIRTPRVPDHYVVDLTFAHLRVNCETYYKSSTFPELKCGAAQWKASNTSFCHTCTVAVDCFAMLTPVGTSWRTRWPTRAPRQD